MKLTYPSAKGFAKAMEAVWNLVDEATLTLTSEGMKIVAMDPSQISMIVFFMGKENFLEYDTEEEKFTIDMSLVKKILKRGRATEMVALSKDQNHLTITFSTEKSRRSFKVPLLELNEGLSNEPKIEYNNYVKMLAEPFKELVKDAQIVTNYVKLIITPDGFEAEAVSESGEVKEVFEKDSEELLEVKAESGARALYSTDYLDDLLKAASKDYVLTLYVETDKPLKLEYESEGAMIRYYLAPKRVLD